MHGSTETITLGLLGLIPLLPLIGAIVNGLLGARASKGFVHTVATGAMLGAFGLSVLAVVKLCATGYDDGAGHQNYIPHVYQYMEWVALDNLTLSVRLWLDTLSAVMLLIITGVGTLIHLYSIGYMSEEKSYARYFAYLNFFVFAMLMLVLGDNLVTLFLGWEGVGVASYLLIGFYYEDNKNADAGKKAFIANRVGDFAVLVGMFLLFQLVGTLTIPEIRERIAFLDGNQLAQVGGWITAITILFFIGCTGKSAQLPLYVWLPDAMAGPTPVSALIHAATMVTAGIYLIARMNFLFVLSPTTMTVIAVIGALTALFAATIALTQFDIKKVLAYSTVSQLGFMFVAVGTGSFFAGVFHLMTHAFFKALLFLAAGSVIHGVQGEQDLRKMGGLKAWMPVTRWTFLLGCLAIAGVPLFSGFFSKDEILWFALSNQHVLGGVNLGWVLWGTMLLSAALTAFYMFRLYFLTFTGTNRSDADAQSKIHESPATMTIPLVVLAFLSVVGGFVGIPAALGEPLGLPNLLHDWLYPVIAPGEALFVQRLDSGVLWMSMGAAVGVALVGIGLAYARYGRGHDPSSDLENAGPVFRFVYNKYYVDELYEWILVRPLRFAGRVFAKFVDKLLIDTILVGMFGAIARWTSEQLGHFQNGNTQRYAAVMVLGLSVILGLLFFL